MQLQAVAGGPRADNAALLAAVPRWVMRNSLNAELAGLSEWVRHAVHASDTVGGAAGASLVDQRMALEDLYREPPSTASAAEAAAEALASAPASDILQRVAERAALYGRNVCLPASGGAAAAAMECQQEREAECEQERAQEQQPEWQRLEPARETAFPCEAIFVGWAAVRPLANVLPLDCAVEEILARTGPQSLCALPWVASHSGGGGVREPEIFVTRNFLSPLSSTSPPERRARLRDVDAILVFPPVPQEEGDSCSGGVLLLLSSREADAVLGALWRDSSTRTGGGAADEGGAAAPAPALVHLTYARGIGCDTGARPAPPPLRLVAGASGTVTAVLTHGALARLQLFNGETHFALGPTPPPAAAGDVAADGTGARGRGGAVRRLRGGAAARWLALRALLLPVPAEERCAAGQAFAEWRGVHEIEGSDLDCAVKGLEKYEV